MTSEIGVLIFPAGEINAVELHDALSSCVNIRLFGASSVERHGAFIFENYHAGVPKISDPDFIAVFNRIIDDDHIDIVIPTHDDVALFLAEKRGQLHAAVLTADYWTTQVCRDKKKIYSLFSGQAFCPQVYEGWDCFPAFLKPRRGQGGAGTRLIPDAARVPAGIDLSRFVICEYLPGKELTVDCLTDNKGTLRAVLPRSRQRIFGGVSVRTGKEDLTPEIAEIAGKINARLHFLGLWYFQIKQDVHGKFKLLEVSARCAGSMCLSRGTGINLPLLSVYTAMGREIQVEANGYQITADRTLISRYETDLEYQRVYIDLDDTLILRESVCLQAIRFLYQCRNRHKQIILLTRHQMDHSDDPASALDRYKIHPGLFDEIIEVPAGVPKHELIDPEQSIFIDNSFAERKAVRETLAIPVFDVSEIEVLLDWRT